MIFIEISSKRIKVGVTFIFRHLVDAMPQWYTSNVLMFLVYLPTQIGLFEPLF